VSCAPSPVCWPTIHCYRVGSPSANIRGGGPRLCLAEANYQKALTGVEALRATDRWRPAACMIDCCFLVWSTSRVPCLFAPVTCSTFSRQNDGHPHVWITKLSQIDSSQQGRFALTLLPQCPLAASPGRGWRTSPCFDDWGQACLGIFLHVITQSSLRCAGRHQPAACAGHRNQQCGCRPDL
jgi:hypothetical protein